MTDIELDYDELEFDDEDFDLGDIEDNKRKIEGSEAEAESINYEYIVMDAEDARRRDPMKALQLFEKVLQDMSISKNESFNLDLWTKCVSNIVNLTSNKDYFNLESISNVMTMLIKKIESTGYEKLVSLVAQVFDSISQDERLQTQVSILSDAIVNTIIKKNLKANDQLCSSYIMSNLACCARSLLKYEMESASRFTDDLNRLSQCYDLIKDAAVDDKSFRMQSCAADICGFQLLNVLISNDHRSVITWKTHWESYLESALMDIDLKAELYSIYSDKLLDGIGWVSKLLIGIFWLLQSLNSIQASSWICGYSFALRALTLFVQEPPNSLVNELIVFTSVFATIIRIYLPTSKTTCTIISLDSSRLKLNEREISILKYGMDLSEEVTNENFPGINMSCRNLLNSGATFSPTLKFIYDYLIAIGGTFLIIHVDGSIGFHFDKLLFEAAILDKYLSQKICNKKNELVEGVVEFTFSGIKDDFISDVFHDDREDHVNDHTMLIGAIKRSIYRLLENNLVDGYTTDRSFFMVDARLDSRVNDVDDILVNRFYGTNCESIGKSWLHWMCDVEEMLKLPRRRSDHYIQE